MLKEDFNCEMSIDAAVEKLNTFHRTYHWLVRQKEEHPSIRGWTDMTIKMERKFLELTERVRNDYLILPLNLTTYNTYFIKDNYATSVKFEYSEIDLKNIYNRETINQLIENHLIRLGISKGTSFFHFEKVIFKM